MKNSYNVVMDPEQNAFMGLPRAQAYQLMVILSWMWTGLFCVGYMGWAWFGELVVAHTAVLLGLFATGTSFTLARRKPAAIAAQTYRDHPRPDGTARYDDVWGG